MIYLPKFQEIEIAHWKSIIDFCFVNYKNIYVLSISSYSTVTQET